MVTPSVERSSGPVIQRPFVRHLPLSLHRGYTTIEIAYASDRAALDYPYVTTLLPNGTIEIHSVETQTIVQVVAAPPDAPSPLAEDRKALISCMGGFFVPSTQRSEKLRMVPHRLLRGSRPRRGSGGGYGDGDLADVPDMPAL